MLFSYSFPPPWCWTLSASQQKPVRRTWSWARRRLGTKGCGEPGRRETKRWICPEDTPHPKGAPVRAVLSPIRTTALCHQYQFPSCPHHDGNFQKRYIIIK